MKYSQPNPTSTPSGDANLYRVVRNNRWIIGVLSLITLGAATIAFQAMLDRRTFRQADNAYKAGNCPVATEEFNRLVHRWRLTDTDDFVSRSQAKITECQAFQTVVDQKINGEFVTALTAAVDFLRSYPNSALIKQTQQQIKAILQGSPATIAQPPVCDRLNFMEQQQLIRASDRQLPPLLQACGQSYAKNGNYAAAIATYERFLQDYPEHQSTSTVKAALALAIVTSAKQTGAGTIDRPPQTSRASFGTTQVTIRNDSPEPLQIVFSGPQPRFEEIEACTNCQTYTIPPQTCPEQGTEQTFTLQPGNYDVVVKSNVDGRVRPYTGAWTLENGAGYGSCFYIVRQIAPEIEP